MKNKKITLVGAGAVGTAFLYSAINKGIADEYAIIDLNSKHVEGNCLDYEDAVLSTSNKNAKIYLGKYSDVSDSDIVVITAGRAQKPGETRLEMISDNAKIMKSIANEIKKNNFKGITIIASNPVDIMTHVYYEVTNFNSKKVISSGTWLDTMRLRIELGKMFNEPYDSINAFILGEHGDSSVATIEYGTINNTPIKELMDKKGISEKKIQELCHFSSHKAYSIIDKKGATFWGIGASLSYICENILNDTNIELPISTLLTGQYNKKNVFIGMPSILNSTGVVSSREFKLSKDEKEKLIKSIEIVENNTKIALKAIK